MQIEEDAAGFNPGNPEDPDLSIAGSAHLELKQFSDEQRFAYLQANSVSGEVEHDGLDFRSS